MKKATIFVLGIILLVSSCVDKKPKVSNTVKPVENILSDTTSQTTQASKKVNPSDVYFKASGTEPFWSLTISPKIIKLNTIEDSIVTPHTTPNLAQDSNVKQYALHTEMAQMNIQISQTECTNAMSGAISPYVVKINKKTGKDKKFTSLKGCGKYVTDYRLHDIWVLEELTEKKVSEAPFEKEPPYMEINANLNSFKGYAGCNTMNGKLFFEPGILRFTDITTTKMMCQQNNLENQFLNALKVVTDYKIENNRLWLSNPSKNLMVLIKID
ncbi:META domain-containing protein [Flavobacteriaceae bacterium GSB9]|nr:META domain-containing protein [Flavobacteriaceae bacterium GSB9]